MKEKFRTPVYGIRCHYGAWWIGGRFEAITWFGRIYFNCSREALREKLRSPELQRTERHERIHMLQVRRFRTRYMGFYLYYIYYFFKAFFRCHSWMKAYYENPFEREAYSCEGIEDYTESHWRDYIGRS